jgi:hypothetical protein
VELASSPNAAQPSWLFLYYSPTTMRAASPRTTMLMKKTTNDDSGSTFWIKPSSQLKSKNLSSLFPSLSLSLSHTHTLVQPCSSAQEQESSSKAKPKSFLHIKRERKFITERKRESLKNSWSFFRVLQRERFSV